MILLHGFTGAPASWRRLRGMLARATTAPPLPGHAPDAPAQPGEGFLGAVARIAGRIDRPEVLAGYSLGARVALATAIEHSDRVAGLILIGVNPGIDDAERAARRDADQRWIRSLEDEGIEPFLEAWRAQPLFASQRGLPEPVRSEQQEIARNHNARQLADALRQMGLAEMPDYRPRLAEVRCPILLVTGELDTKFTAIAERMQAALPQARREVVPGAGHNPVLEAPEVIAKLLDG